MKSGDVRAIARTALHDCAIELVVIQMLTPSKVMPAGPLPAEEITLVCAVACPQLGDGGAQLPPYPNARSVKANRSRAAANRKGALKGGKLSPPVFDGLRLVTNLPAAKFTRLRRDAHLQGTFPVSKQPAAICFDGASIWVGGN